SRKTAPNATLEIPVLHAIVVILHEFRNIVIRHRTAIGALRQRRENLLRAGFGRLSLVLRGVAGQDAIAAWRRTETLHIEGAQKLKRVHAIGAILPAAGRVDLQLIVGFGETLAPESDADLVRSRRRLEFDVLQAGIDAI